ncbi:RNA polymerase sigma-70 factor, ECF subfamily [Clostridium cavendishii DSM 21758]|uniref:RNA polymerase sigma-70 factor, ECF subfamily n=1 Tax=Clostridium cavendishii DSM 21758 TaxID=1121302 RepID=A0A1M6LZL0_9CLOT|nr:sigma-70 family RNA polymerase sigma factor [Clostridium cavendishii]SHJ76592.1 RNA polymerase sigma-70 factor, ECF subfamily [Clostridium cavendishii DSM 21758]
MVYDEDKKLVQEVLAGNIDSFNILINKYEMIVLRFIYGIIKDKEASEDISQETFITVYNKLYQYNNEYKFSNWILQIAKNKALDYIRKFRRVYEANIEECVDLKSNEKSPEESYEYKETKGYIRKFIDSLDTIDKQIFILRYSNEKTFFEISEILDMKESTVKRHYYNAREEFLKIYKKNIGGEGYGL